MWFEKVKKMLGMDPLRKGRFLLTALPFFVFGISATANDEEVVRVVILGDSITAGYGLEPEEAYPALLQAKADARDWSVVFVNAGLSGDTSSGGVRRVGWVLSGGADVLLIALGGNDGLRGLDPEQMEANLLAIARRAKALEPRVQLLVAGMQMPDSMGETYARDFRRVFSRVAEAVDARLIPYLLEGVGGVPDLNLPDRIHPNAPGQQKIAATVWETLEPLLEGVLSRP